MKEAEKERDQLAIKSESMQEALKKNNVEFDQKQFEAQTGVIPNKDLVQKTGIID